jgi:two-component system sensor histidine kinase KdpD
MRRGYRDGASLGIGLGAVAVVTLVYVSWLHVSNAAIVSTSFLMVVLFVAASARLWVAVVTSVAAMGAFNYFFLPPVGTLTIADPQNWVALVAFLVVSLVASQLSAAVRARAQEALGRRDELARLFDLSRDILVMTEGREALASLARSIGRRFDLEFVGIAVPRADDWDLFEAGARTVPVDRAALSAAYAAAQTTLEFDAQARTYAGHQVLSSDGQTLRLVPLRVGTRPVGLLAAAGRSIEPGTLDALAGLVAIAWERLQFLEERKAADLTRKSEELKSALLASLAHDLRTPLTAIRVAAGNLQASWLTDDGRREQSDLILSEVERLARLFQNILDMARLDAGAVSVETRWAHPSEILEAAREQVEHSLRGHTIDQSIDRDIPVRLDPRLTAAAVAHLLENAAQYAPAGSAIDVRAAVSDTGLSIAVRDHGPGIAPNDLPHLFERFYRGAIGQRRTSGTGMGLSIARGLLAVEHGRVWAENVPGGGALFTIVVPAEIRVPEVASEP